LGKEMRVRGGGGAGKIPATSHYPAQTKRESFNYNKEKHHEMNKSWPEAREYDTIPEKEERKRSPDMPIEILHNGSRQTLCTHQSQKPFAKRVGKTHFY
jgi:hypothetical protein